MTALTQARATKSRSGDTRSFPLAAGATIYLGALVAVNANGFVVPMSTALNLQGVGRAEQAVDNSNGADGAETVAVGAGIFNYENSAAADEIDKSNVGATCYGVDDQTVALTNGTNTRSPAGTVFDVDEAGVWVKFS